MQKNSDIANVTIDHSLKGFDDLTDSAGVKAKLAVPYGLYFLNVVPPTRLWRERLVRECEPERDF